MCGIAGYILKNNSVDRQTVAAMVESLSHRGPDGSGVFVKDNVALGHRRLAIIDTSPAANQPLFNEDGTVGVVFNGEIYNFQALRRELTDKGHFFATRSDTEVIVHAWEEHGPECLRLFRGMFALAVFDLNKKNIFLARDRLGKKPLFYSLTNDCFAFASEIKALLQVPGLSREIDHQALAGILK